MNFSSIPGTGIRTYDLPASKAWPGAEYAWEISAPWLWKLTLETPFRHHWNPPSLASEIACVERIFSPCAPLSWSPIFESYPHRSSSGGMDFWPHLPGWVADQAGPGLGICRKLGRKLGRACFDSCFQRVLDIKMTSISTSIVCGILADQSIQIFLFDRHASE